MNNQHSDSVEPYDGGSHDLVTMLRWIRGHVSCVKPGRERVWQVFECAIDLAEMMTDALDSHG